MRKVLAFAMLFGLAFASAACAAELGSFSLPCLKAFNGNVTVNPYVQAGFQKVGSNMDLPVDREFPTPGLLQIGTLSIAVRDANFWTGTAGTTIKAGELLSFFAAVGGSLNRPFTIVGEIPISSGGIGAQPTIEFDANKLSMWYAQGGVALGPVLLGLYGDHFGIDIGDPRQGSVPLNNQTLRADLISTTLAPYIGIAIPASNALISIIYSPLATSNTTVALRTSIGDVAQARYKWNKPGNFFSFSFQYNQTPSATSSVGVWGNCTYMTVRGNAELNFQDSTLGISRQRDVTASLTKYVIQGGLMFGLNF